MQTCPPTSLSLHYSAGHDLRDAKLWKTLTPTYTQAVDTKTSAHIRNANLIEESRSCLSPLPPERWPESSRRPGLGRAEARCQCQAAEHRLHGEVNKGTFT